MNYSPSHGLDASSLYKAQIREIKLMMLENIFIMLVRKP